ncbi:gonadotropin-releasing hormone II receptor-like [Thrips palmi]|uniref:Gonadotropin-releasing hormone II receptor-like n=1 Tax=Thrips palmi TaxID=161013 RepID=A0A6P8Z2Y6_THRPL|nr:gonadotropin-releasing hormone II receptor-like [Thrips palmi]
MDAMDAENATDADSDALGLAVLALGLGASNGTVSATLATANNTLEFLASLPVLYKPLYRDLVAWLADVGVAVDANDTLFCETKANVSRLPVEVCERLDKLHAPMNGTLCQEHAPTLTNPDVVRAALLALLALLSFVGNCYTINSIRNKASPAPVYKLILHLSVADALVSLVCIAGEAAWMLVVQWTFGNVACKVFKFLEMTALHGSSYVVVLIAQNRWVAVSHPLASRRHNSSLCGTVWDTVRCASPRSVLFVWILGAFASVPQLIMFSVKEGPFIEPYYQCVTHGVVSTESVRMYNIINFITLFVFPLLGLICSYLSIYCTLSKGQREIHSVDKITIAAHDQNRQRSMKRAMVKSRWIAVVIVCAYLVSWIPYYISMLAHFLSSGPEVPLPTSEWMDWIFFFGMANSVVNPAIYGMFQLWKPKARRQWSCFRQRDGSTQLTQFTDSFRRHAMLGLTPPEAAAAEQALQGVNGYANGHANGGVPPLRRMPSSDRALPPPPPPPPPSAPLVAPPPPPPASTEATAETMLLDSAASTNQAASRAPGDAVVEVPVIRTKAGPFSWRTRFLRKYRALRAHSAHQTHI